MISLDDRIENMTVNHREYFLGHMIKHLYKLSLHNRVARFLTDFRYLSVKLNRKEPLSLIGDYAYSNRPEIQRIGKILDLSAHILRQYPDQLWEQLYCRLWKDADPAIARLLNNPVQRPWLKSLSDNFSKQEAPLIRSLYCDNEPVAGVICWDANTLVAGTEGGMVFIFDTATGRLRRRFRAHQTEIESIHKSPRGIVTTAHDGTIGVWRLENGQSLFTDKIHAGSIARSVVGPSGQYFVTCGLEGGLFALDLNDFAQIEIDAGRRTRYTAVAISGDDMLALASSDKTVSFFRLPEGERVGTTKPLEATAHCLTFNEGSRGIFAGDKSGTVWRMHIDDDAAPENLYNHADGICQLTIHETTRTLYSASEDGEIVRWDMEAEEKRGSLFRHYGPVTALCFSEDGSRFYSAGWDRAIRVWDANGEDQIGIYRGHSDEISTMDMDAGSGLIASGSWDGTIRIWNVNNKMDHQAAAHHDEISMIRFGKDAETIVTASNDGLLKVHDTATLKTLHVLEGHTHWVTHFAFCGDTHLLSASDDHTVRLWEIAGGRCEKTFSGHGDDVIGVQPVCALPGTAVSHSTDGSMILWNVTTGKIMKRFHEHEGGIWDSCVHPRKPLAVTASDDKTVKVWDLLRSGSQLTLSGHQRALAAIAMCPETMRIISGDDGGNIIVWDLESGASLMKFQDHQRDIHQLIVTSDEKFCIASADDGHISVRALNDGRLLCRFPVHREPGFIDQIQLAADDRWLISCTDSGWIHVWDWRNGTAIAALQADVGVGAIDCSDDGRLITAGDAAGRIHLFSLEGA
ncbi:hypothetical protein JCM12296A_00520 [Desulfosarcina cetonica]